MKADLKLDIKLKDFGKSQFRLVQFANRLSVAISQSIAYEATVLAGDIRRGIRSGAPGGKRFAPLAESTIKMKGSSKPLINHGDLLRSVHHERFNKDRYSASYFVGVHRREKTKDGGEMVNIAEAMEYGTNPYMIKVTERMRRFWYAMYKKGIFKAPLSKKKVVIHHPGLKPRPFLQPSFDKWKSGAEMRIVQRIKKRLRIQ